MHNLIGEQKPAPPPPQAAPAKLIEEVSDAVAAPKIAASTSIASNKPKKSSSKKGTSLESVNKPILQPASSVNPSAFAAAASNMNLSPEEEAKFKDPKVAIFKLVILIVLHIIMSN